MTPTPQAIENAARAHAVMRKRITGSAIERLPSDRLYAEAILRSDLGDMVLVPREPTDKMICAALDDSDKKTWKGESYSTIWRAMIAAAEDER